MGLGIAFARSFIELLIFYAIYLVAVTYFVRRLALHLNKNRIYLALPPLYCGPVVVMAFIVTSSQKQQPSRADLDNAEAAFEVACDISNDADRIAGATLASGESVLILLSSSNESSDVAAREFASILARPKYGFGEIRKGTKAASSRQEQCRDEGYGASCLDNTNGIRVWRHGGWQDERDAQETTSRNVVAIEGPTVEFAYFKRFIVSVRYDNELVSQANFFQLDTPQPKWCPDLSRLMEQIVDESTVIESETTTAH